MENLAGEKMNGLTQFQPRKLEELLPNANIMPDTYILYPEGGYHPFYGTFNTLPKYQQRIWPYVKRIKYHERFKSKEKLDKSRKGNLRKNQNLSQISSALSTNSYVFVVLDTTGRFMRVGGKYLEPKRRPVRLHRLVALAWIQNPESKKNVLHMDDDPTNYLRENLKWGTQSENTIGKARRLPDTMEQKYFNLVKKGIIKG